MFFCLGFRRNFSPFFLMTVYVLVPLTVLRRSFFVFPFSILVGKILYLQVLLALLWWLYIQVWFELPAHVPSSIFVGISPSTIYQPSYLLEQAQTQTFTINHKFKTQMCVIEELFCSTFPIPNPSGHTQFLFAWLLQWSRRTQSFSKDFQNLWFATSE